MSFFIKTEIEWLEKHAVADTKDNIWKCKETKEPIIERSIGRSNHTTPGAGFGEVRTILHLHCPKCEPNKNLPTSGTPILESDLVELVDAN